MIHLPVHPRAELGLQRRQNLVGNLEVRVDLLHVVVVVERFHEVEQLFGLVVGHGYCAGGYERQLRAREFVARLSQGIADVAELGGSHVTSK